MKILIKRTESRIESQQNSGWDVETIFECKEIVDITEKPKNSPGITCYGYSRVFFIDISYSIIEVEIDNHLKQGFMLTLGETLKNKCIVIINYGQHFFQKIANEVRDEILHPNLEASTLLIKNKNDNNIVPAITRLTVSEEILKVKAEHTSPVENSSNVFFNPLCDFYLGINRPEGNGDNYYKSKEVLFPKLSEQLKSQSNKEKINKSNSLKK